METWQVLHIEICGILPPLAGMVLLHMCKHHLLTLDGYHNVGYKIPTDQSIHMYPYLYKFYLMESNRL